MYIPTAIIVLLIILYYRDRDNLHDEISSLRDELNPKDNYRYDNYDDYDNYLKPEKDIPLIKATDYTFQESQDRQLFNVTYKATLAEIRQVYLNKMREHNLNPKPELEISNIQSAYKRLEKIELLRKHDKSKIDTK
jgi:hypothetical protein